MILNKLTHSKTTERTEGGKGPVDLLTVRGQLVRWRSRFQDCFASLNILTKLSTANRTERTEEVVKVRWTI